MEALARLLNEMQSAGVIRNYAIFGAIARFDIRKSDRERQRLDRQARWQKSRKALSWPEKVRIAERTRDAIKGLRGRPAPRRSGPPTPPPGPRP